MRSAALVLGRNALGRRFPVRPVEEHLAGALAWLRRAQAQTSAGGSPAYYGLLTGWAAAYPETSGYLIPTLFAASAYADRNLRDQAIAMADWLISLQMPEGGFPAGLARSNAAPAPSVFNSGQILLGMMAAYRETGDRRYLVAGTAAGRWLSKIQSADGSWRQHTYRNQLHSYKTRVAWALLELYKETGEERFHNAARKNLDWALSCQQPNGWFRYAPFWGERAFTHTVSYVLEGLLSAGQILNESSYLAAVDRALESIVPLVREDGWLPGSFDSNWRPTWYCCLTGNAQLAGVMLRRFAETGDPRYEGGGRKLLSFVKSTQDLDATDPDLRGAIGGSYPVWGRYLNLCYPNWAAKFFCDSLLQELELSRKVPAQPSDREAGIAARPR
ncbi:MAG: glycoside hydrolase family 127 protein [Acidobacteriota bacterium]|nr:glycoside hydrolase family 127 protein [Acidobacteriota bacterium]